MSELQERINRLDELLSLLNPIPPSWISTSSQGKKGVVELQPLPCDSWKVLTTAWRKAMKWIEGLDRALAVMLATVTSTESVGDQLWVKIIGPPSSGKTVLCEALSVARNFVYPKDTITGLFSGYQTDREGTEDMSLAPRIKNKTLVIKDGDTLLQQPNLLQILAQFRALYDRAVRTQYRNKMSKDHEGLSCTLVLCGTEALRHLDSSELGERLLDCVITDMLDADTEDAIAYRKALQAEREVSMRSDGRADTREGPEMIAAKQLTGGYVEYLRKHAQDLLGEVEMGEESLRQCVSLGTFVAFMRSRPSKRQDETAQRELSFRLVSQMVRLAKCLAVVLNRETVDEDVMKRVRSVALDTSRGRTLEIVKHLAHVGEGGAEVRALAVYTGYTEDKERSLLGFLRRIGAVERFAAPNESGKIRMTVATRWRMTERLQRLYKEVIGAQA